MPTEPTPEAYEAAARARLEQSSAYRFTASDPDKLAKAVAEQAQRLSVRVVVDAAWPIAEATVRAKVAAEIRAAGVDLRTLRRAFDLAARIAEGKGDETP